MSMAKAGDFVQIFYTGSLTNGEVFDSNEGGQPLEFQLGQGQVIEGFGPVARQAPKSFSTSRLAAAAETFPTITMVVRSGR